MASKISVVLNTLNEEENVQRAIKTLDFADEILVCDMHSDDNTAIVAKKMGAKVIFTKRLEFVEPARNLAISKTANEWVLVLDPDEEVPESLGKKLQEIADNPGVITFVEVPRKNIIFDKWVKSAMWWPDYNIRFFKKNAIEWSNQIHRPPKTQGQGLKLAAEERWAIIHHHYDSISQFLRRLDRYTNIQAKELKKEGVEFEWLDLFKKPLSEFLSRFFVHKGYEDGLHGLALSFLQAFSFLIVYLKLWELKGFEKKEIKLTEVREISMQSGKEIDYWFKYGNLSKNPLKSFLQRAKNKIT